MLYDLVIHECINYELKRSTAPNKNDLYFLCVTWSPPLSTDFLIEVQAIRSVSNSSSPCYKLNSDTIWPLGNEPTWEVLKNKKYNRSEFTDFCNAFTIELALPISSESLKEPSILEQALITLVKNKVGIGSYPNSEREPIDFSALAISLANLARTQNATHTPNSIESELGLRTDFGKVAQEFPVNFEAFVNRDAFEKSITEDISDFKHQIIIGKPGAGKSWSLTQLSKKLSEQDICVANHYCYLEPGDEHLEKRISTDSLFANLLFELTNQLPELRDHLSARYSSTIDSLNEAIKKSALLTNTIVLIIDGLDHISRVLSESNQLSLSDADVIGQLCSLTLPENVVLIIGSQPGEHLDRIVDVYGKKIEIKEVPDWNRKEIEALLEVTGVNGACSDKSEFNFTHVTNEIFVKSEGNPLYTTFLAKDLIQNIDTNIQFDLEDWIENKPHLDGNVASYYKHILLNINDGSELIANILGVIDFGVTIEELKQVVPILSGVIDKSIKHLAPILTDVTGQGGLRIYHESFRRFVVENSLSSTPLALILEPVVHWLTNLNFYKSAKSYRFLLVLLRRQKEFKKILELVSTQFISKSVELGHSRLTIEKNLDLAIDIASQTQCWVSLVKYSELKRSLHTCFEEKLYDQFGYWETFTKVFGAELTADRLLFDGKPTLSKRLGLAVCAIIDDERKVAPWREYLQEIDEQENDRVYMSSSDKPQYDDNFEHSLNRFKGLISTRGGIVGYSRLIKYLARQTSPIKESYINNLVLELQPYFSPEINLRISRYFVNKTAINSEAIIAIAHLCYAKRSDSAARKKHATLAIEKLKTLHLVKDCIILGATPEKCSITLRKPENIPLHIGNHSSNYEDIFEWYISLHINQTSYTKELARIRGGDNWYCQWLEFLLLSAKYRVSLEKPKPSDIFKVISLNTEPFKGQPRTCDLYSVRDLLIESIIDGLQFTSSESELEQCLAFLKIAIDETATSMDRSDSGPIQVIDLLRRLCSTNNLEHFHQPILSD